MISQEDALKKISDNLGYVPQVRYPNEWKGVMTRIELCCPQHGWYTQKVTDAYKRTGCKICGSIKSATSRITPVEKAVEKISENLGYKAEIRYEGEWKGVRTRIEIKCPKHGWFPVTVANAYSHKCPVCSSKKVTREEAFEKIFDTLGYVTDIRVPSEWHGGKTHIDILCPKHGWFNQEVSEAYKFNGCKECANEKRSASVYKARQENPENFRMVSKEDALKRISDNLGYIPQIRYPNEWKGNYTYVELCCPKHGWRTQRVDGAYIHGCPSCRDENRIKICGRRYTYNNERFDSKWEIYFYSYLKDKGIEFEREIPMEYYVGKKRHVYFCDFYLVEEDKYMEVKGAQFFTEDGKVDYIWTNGLDEEELRERTKVAEAKHKIAVERNITYITEVNKVNPSWFKYNEGVQTEDISRYRSWFYEHHTDLEISVWERGN